MNIKSILFLISLFGPLVSLAGETPTAVKSEPIHITVYKTPTCGCCAKWVEYLESHGFVATVVDQNNLARIKGQYGIAPHLRSCHTGIVEGYAIEGHVPVDDIHRLLKERPAVSGLTAPGMPTHSPGMMSLVPRGYDVLLFMRSGETEPFSSY